MAKWSKGAKGFQSIVIVIETLGELQELVESLGDNSGQLLEKLYRDLDDYCDLVESQE